jgi:hypothetical protein
MEINVKPLASFVIYEEGTINQFQPPLHFN